MSLKEAIKRLAQPEEAAAAEEVVPPKIVGWERRAARGVEIPVKRYENLERATGIQYPTLMWYCDYSTATREWCEYMDAVCVGRPADPPLAPFPDRLADVAHAVVKSVGNVPEFLRRVVEARALKDLAKEVVKGLDAVSEAVTLRRFHDAREAGKITVERVAKAVREFGRPAGEVAEKLAAEVGPMLREARKPEAVTAVKALVEAIKAGATSEEAAERIVAEFAKTKAPEKEVAPKPTEIKELAQEESEPAPDAGPRKAFSRLQPGGGGL